MEGKPINGEPSLIRMAHPKVAQCHEHQLTRALTTAEPGVLEPRSALALYVVCCSLGAMPPSSWSTTVTCMQQQQTVRYKEL
eukprot:1156047-Pelagomonas_calceolata.AAC.2